MKIKEKIIKEIPFNPTDVAKEDLGHLVSAIKKSQNYEPRGSTFSTFNTALLLKEGLKALLSPEEREGLDLPIISDEDPSEIREAQSNYTEVFKSGKDATDEQISRAHKAISAAALQLKEQEYEKYALTVRRWLDLEAAKRPGGDVKQAIKGRKETVLKIR
jgi:hypothetical protein